MHVLPASPNVLLLMDLRVMLPPLYRFAEVAKSLRAALAAARGRHGDRWCLAVLCGSWGWDPSSELTRDSSGTPARCPPCLGGSALYAAFGGRCLHGAEGEARLISTEAEHPQPAVLPRFHLAGDSGVNSILGTVADVPACLSRTAVGSRCAVEAAAPRLAHTGSLHNWCGCLVCWGRNSEKVHYLDQEDPTMYPCALHCELLGDAPVVVLLLSLSRAGPIPEHLDP